MANKAEGMKTKMEGVTKCNSCQWNLHFSLEQRCAHTPLPCWEAWRREEWRRAEPLTAGSPPAARPLPGHGYTTHTECIKQF